MYVLPEALASTKLPYNHNMIHFDIIFTCLANRKAGREVSRKADKQTDRKKIDEVEFTLTS